MYNTREALLEAGLPGTRPFVSYLFGRQVIRVTSKNLFSFFCFSLQAASKRAESKQCAALTSMSKGRAPANPSSQAARGILGRLSTKLVLCCQTHFPPDVTSAVSFPGVSDEWSGRKLRHRDLHPSNNTQRDRDGHFQNTLIGSGYSGRQRHPL